MASETGTRIVFHVDLGKVETIFPAEPTDTSSPLYLTVIDQCVVYTVDTIYFYPPTTAKLNTEVVSQLREALARILVPYHFMAGRLQLNDECKLQIACNRAGALFVAASANVRLCDLGDVAHPNPAFRRLVLQQSSESMSDSPLLMMQVTTFKCGGFSVGFSMNHVLFDGLGALEFVMNFSAVARGEPLVCQPLPDRSVLKPRDPPFVEFDHPEYLKLSDIPKGTAFTTADVAQLSLESIKLSQRHVYKIFPFSAEMLRRLKTTAAMCECSSFDAITAHVWQARTKAIGMPAAALSKVLFAVDIRSKLSPPLSKGFCGNAVLSAFASVPAGELRQHSLSFAISKVQEATNKITDPYIRSSIDWGAVHGGVPNLPGGIFVSAWWKLPFYLVDFGWGRPVYAGPVVNAMVEFVLLLSNGTSEGLNLYLALEPEHMEKFEQLIYDF